MAAVRHKVMIVEDEETLSQMYAFKFEKEGFEVRVARDGESALDAVTSFHPDIILLDIILPKIDGFSVLEELKKNAATKKIPVIMLTNLGQDEDMAKGKKMGAVDYLVKADCTPIQVVEKVRAYVT